MIACVAGAAAIGIIIAVSIICCKRKRARVLAMQTIPQPMMQPWPPRVPYQYPVGPMYPGHYAYPVMNVPRRPVRVLF